MDASAYDDGGYFGSWLREARHSPCMMQPTVLLMFLTFGIFMLVTMAIQVPALLLGLIMAPVLQRSSWYVEFLYPWGIARRAHFFLISHSSKKGHEEDKNRGFHSRTIEQRVEVVPGRVYIHPIPQFLDNLGYLVVCLPRPKSEHARNVKITVEDETDPIVALMVDCGEVEATLRAVELIQQQHYKKRQIQIHSILSTHKHHDHTGGNKGLMSHTVGKNIDKVFGAAVERVPQCNYTLTNGDRLPLPCAGSNDMNELIEIESVAVPAHTRGSLVFRLLSKVHEQREYMFTGDTMFSAGGGVPFESDIGTETETQVSRYHGNTFIRSGIGSTAIERCFAEVLARALPTDKCNDAMERVLVFPGHEYTAELLSRQFQGTAGETCRWKNFSPTEFFKTASHLYIALHRRSLPHNSGKLLMVPTTLDREIHISPHYRSLKRTGEMVARAITFWHSHFCMNKVGSSSPFARNGHSRRNSLPNKTSSNLRQWNVDATEAQREVFTTVYSADLELLIKDLAAGGLSTDEAARQLRDMTRKLDDPVVNKRAIPGYLPSDRNIYKGVSGLVLLGSPPSAMTLSDSRSMKLPPPIDSNSDRIMVSLKRLLLVLGRLGLLAECPDDLEAMTRQLWVEARDYATNDGTSGGVQNGDIEAEPSDQLDLGLLKWVMYGVPANQPSWFSSICCMPCSSLPKRRVFPDHPAADMKQKSGDLVSHDVLTCPLCRNGSGCVELSSVNESDSALLRIHTNGSGLPNDASIEEETGIEMDELADQLLLAEHE